MKQCVNSEYLFMSTYNKMLSSLLYSNVVE